MKIYAVNGSPRKGWNCSQLLDSFVKGIKDTEPNAEVEIVNLYDYDYKGCRSCFVCKLKNTPNECMIKDSIHDILSGIRSGDGLVYASPVYYFDQSGEFRSFMERLLYPGPVQGKTIPVTAIYAMNAVSREEYEQYFGQHFKFTHMMIQNCLHGEFSEICAFDTYQREDSDRYQPSKSDHVAKKLRHDREFPALLEQAYEAGRKMAESIRTAQTAEKAAA